MAVPKKRTGHSAQGKRRSNWKAAKPALTKCPNCGQAVLAHTVCTACGTYKGKAVSKKGAAEAEVKQEAVKEEVKETKKKTTTRKSTKKAKAEETMSVLVPIAHRLGINSIKSELENLRQKAK